MLQYLLFFDHNNVLCYFWDNSEMKEMSVHSYCCTSSYNLPCCLQWWERIGGVMVSVLSSSVVDRDREFESRLGQTKDYKICICCFSDKHVALRRKTKCWLARNQNNVSEWSDISIRGLLFQWASTTTNPTKPVGLVQSRPCHHLIENKLVLAMI